MEKKRLPLTVKILNLIPRSFQKIIGYSFLGTKILQYFKSSDSKTAFDIDYGLKIYLELSNPFTWDLILGKDFEKASGAKSFGGNLANVYFNKNKAHLNLFSYIRSKFSIFSSAGIGR